MQYHNIPDELRSLVQWCVWKFEPTDTGKPTKVPYNPLTGKHASATDRQTWVSFDEAVGAVRSQWGYDGIGFFFSRNDPYCGIDLDYTTDPETAVRQQQIFEAFNSYAERSPSGKGLHIIIKASVPHGRKRDSVEIYSQDRYFTMTGDVYRSAPIADCHDIANELWAEMAPPTLNENGFYGDPLQREDDATIFERARQAANGDKFIDLWNGNWNAYYSSQSEADFALVDIIAYYTQNQPQIARMFRSSALGNRAKANRDNYVYPMITRAFDNQLPPVDFSGLLDRLEAAKAQSFGGSAPVAASAPVAGTVVAPKEAVAHLTGALPPFSFDKTFWQETPPPGILRLVMDYVHASSPRPVREISLVAAIGLMAGMAGRQFNVSGTGLNLYMMLIADTGKGKEAIASGISRIISSLSDRLKVAKEIYGPAEIASGQALLKYLATRNKPSFISLTGEFGIRLKQITDPNASTAEKTLLRVLLNLYSKSGAGQSVEPSIYADKANNTEVIHSPAFTLLGESTGETFYQALDEDSVATGLLPRFIIVEYNGPRPPFNASHADIAIPEQLIAVLEMFALEIEKMADQGIVQNIGVNDDAKAYLDWINDFCDDQINKSNREVLRQLWNRVHLKVFKLAGLLAVSHNWRAPVIDYDMVRWAAGLIVTDTERLLRKFAAGEMGEVNLEDQQLEYMRKTIGHYIRTPFEQQNATNATRDMHSNGTFNYKFIQAKVISSAPFRKDRRGGTAALKRTLGELISIGALQMVPKNEMANRFKHNGEGYAVIDPNWFLNS